MLNNIGASTEPWGTPFLRRRSLLCWPSLVWRVKLRLVSISITKPTMLWSGIVCRSLRWSSRSQMVLYAAVRSRRTMPAFSPRWKESLMSWVRRVTWSMVDFPRRKPACSFGSFGSITGSRCAWRRRSKILYGTQSRAMGRYPFGSSSGLLGFGRAMTLARRHIFGSLDVRKQMEQNDRSHSVALLPWCRMNSWWMLSIPAALFGFRCLIADFILSLVNSPEVGVDAEHPAYVIHFTDGLPGELLVGIEEPPVADQLRCDGVTSDGAWFWFCCLAGQLVDGLPRSSAGVGEVD